MYLYLRPKSKTASAPGSVPHTPVPSDDPIDMLQDRITLANTISTLENEAQDNNYTTTTTDNSVLPVGAEEMGSGKQCIHLTNGGRIEINFFIIIFFVFPCRPLTNEPS